MWLTDVFELFWATMELYSREISYIRLQLIAGFGLFVGSKKTIEYLQP